MIQLTHSHRIGALSTNCLHIDRSRRMQKLVKAKVSASYVSPITILKSACFLSGTLSTVDGVTLKSPTRKR